MLEPSFQLNFCRFCRLTTPTASLILSAHEGDALPTFIVTCLIPFLRGAQERLQRVYQRMMEFAQEHAAARSQEQEDAGGSSSSSAMHEQD